MKKSIYSLVLADDIIAQIDRMAYEQGTSRSNLVNQLLAERLSLSTPEMRMRDIFSSLEKLIDGSLQVLDQSSDSILQVRSPLRFRYRPTIRYQLELNREGGEPLGTLRVSLRTTSRQLLDLLDAFFILWIQLEQSTAADVLGHAIRYRKEDGRLVRELYHPANLPAYSGEDVGGAIADYIKRMDTAIKQFFSLADAPASERASAVGALYLRSFRDPDTVII